MEFSKKLEDARRASSLSQEEVATALNMSRPTYFNLEQGKREPTLEELRIISELFGITVSDLVSESPADVSHQSSVPTSALEPNFDEQKYESVLIYMLGKIGALPNVGETVIYKLLYFIETNFLLKHDRQLINESFYKKQYGPVPVHFYNVTDKMVSSNKLDIASGQYFMYKQKKYLPRVNYDSSLSEEELAIIDQVINSLAAKSATELSDLSHKDLPWIQANSGDIIDLKLVKYRNAEVSSVVGN